MPLVYFIRREDGEGPIKIGCSDYPAGRLAAFDAGSPYPLAMIASLPGSEVLEQRFHAHFLAHWTRREWFSPAPELLQVIQEINGGIFDPAVLPAPKRLPYNRNITAAVARASADMRRIYRLADEGYAIPPGVEAATKGRYRASAETVMAKRAVVREFLAGVAADQCRKRAA